jgi:hypothetical protein
MEHELTIEYILTMLQGQKDKTSMIQELSAFLSNSAEMVDWLWKTMNDIHSNSNNVSKTPKKTIDLRAIKKTSIENKTDLEKSQNTKQNSEYKTIKTREVKVNKSNHNDPFPNFLITVPVKNDPPPLQEPPPKKRKLSPEKTEQNEVYQTSPEKEETSPQIPKPAAEIPVKQKALRCVYFPACTKQNCPFFHPTELCKNPLVCTFGPTLCRYIHPPCKFGSRCSRPDCVYSHPREALIDCRNGYSCPQKETCIYRHPPEACIFSPKCRNQVCTFSHAVPCQYGVNCHIPGCTFGHKTIPVSNIVPNEESIEVLSASLPKTPPINDSSLSTSPPPTTAEDYPPSQIPQPLMKSY